MNDAALQAGTHQPHLQLCDSSTCWRSFMQFTCPKKARKKTLIKSCSLVLLMDWCMWLELNESAEGHIYWRVYLLKHFMWGDNYWYFIMSLIKGRQHRVFINGAGLVQINMSVHFIMAAKWVQLGVFNGLGGPTDQTINCILHSWNTSRLRYEDTPERFWMGEKKSSRLRSKSFREETGRDHCNVMLERDQKSK